MATSEVPPPDSLRGGRAVDRLLRLFAMRRGEPKRALLAFAYLFLIICSYLLIKAIRNAMFISEFGAIKLPYVMLGIAFLAGGFAAAYIRLSRSIDTPRLVVGTLVFFASNVALFWWLALAEHRWLYPVIYLWAGVFGVIAPMQVWTLANDLFTTREAKRLFGVVGAGGILGAVVGGWLASKLAPLIGTANLMLVVVGMLLVAALVVRWLTPLRRQTQPRALEKPPQTLRASFRLIGTSKHLRLMAGLVFISALATTSVDFQFSLVAERAFSQRDQLTAFFGAVYGSVSLLAFVLQIVLTSRVLAFAGVGFSILLLPFALISSTVALLMTKSLVAGIFLKGSDGALKHSLDRSCRELMYLPVPPRIKVHAKSTIDTVMDRMGDGSAGALQIILTAGLGFGLRGSLFANLGVIATWFLLALGLRKQYVDQLRESIRRPRQNPIDAALVREAATRETLEEVLRSGDATDQLTALEWIAREDITVSEAIILDLVRRPPSPEVQRAALAVLLSAQGSEFPAELMQGLEEEGHQALVSAIDAVVEADSERRIETLGRLLETSGEATRLTLVAYVLRRLGDEFTPFAERVFDTLLAPATPRDMRQSAVRALGLLPADSPLLERVGALLADDDLEVALVATEVAGSLRLAQWIPEILRSLGHPGLRAAARRALVRLDAAALDPLLGALADHDSSVAVRRQIPSTLAGFGGSAVTEGLLHGFQDPDYLVGERCLDALHRRRRTDESAPPVDVEPVVAAVGRLVQRHAMAQEAMRALEAEGPATGGATDFLREVLDEECARIRDGVFRLLGLRYSLQDIGWCWFATRQGSTGERANAVELLDNMLSKHLKELVVPMLESHMRDPAAKGSAPAPPAFSATMKTLTEWPNPWVAACAWHTMRSVPTEGFEEAARQASRSAEPMLRDEAAAFLAGAAVGGGRP